MVATLKVIAYLRCSTVEQMTDGMSLDAQMHRIKAWALAAGAEIVEVVRDGGVSGTVALVDRPAGQRVAHLIDARRPAIDAIVITRLDRLSRNAAEALAYLQKFSTGRLGLVSLADRLDLSTAQGRAMASLSAVFSELERGLCAQRTAEALGVLRDSGRQYSPVPYGFASVDGALVVVAAEQRVLASMRRRRERGESFQRIATALNKRREPARRGGRWFASSVRSVLLTNDKLAGVAVRTDDAVMAGA